MKKILITGANGLLGRIFAEYLSEMGYQVFGIDYADEGTPSKRFIVDGAMNSPLLKKPFCGKFNKTDITVMDSLRETINKMGKIDIVIHLATAGETETAETIKHINETGTKNMFHICDEEKIQKIVFASSIMVVGGKLLNEEPYCFINEGAYAKVPTDLKKITADCRAMPKEPIPAIEAYITSKFKGEDLALDYVKKGISTTCLRFGAISSTDVPYDTPGLRSIWCSHRDACHFVGLSVENLINSIVPSLHTYYVCSHNDYIWVDMVSAERELGFVSNDNAEKYLKENRFKETNTIDFRFSIFSKDISQHTIEVRSNEAQVDRGRSKTLGSGT